MSSQDVKAKPAASPLDLYQPGLNPAEQEAGDCERSAATATREGIPVNLHLRNAPAAASIKLVAYLSVF
jgi:hypothetical protein